MTGRKIHVRWTEADTVEALSEAYRQEREGKLRMRLHGPWLVRRGDAIGQTAVSVGVHYRTVQRWVRWYEAGGLAAVRTHRQGGKGQAPKLTAAQQVAVGAEVASGRFRVAAEIGEWITTTYGVTYRPGGLYSLLTRLRCRPKVSSAGSSGRAAAPARPAADRTATAGAGTQPGRARHRGTSAANREAGVRDARREAGRA